MGKLVKVSPLHQLKPPKGATLIQGRAGGIFWNPSPGDVIEGTLIGSHTVKNQNGEDRTRYDLVLLDGSALTLPDHFDLTSRLEGVTVPRHLWIGFLGFIKANVPGGRLAQYKVATMDPLELGQELVPRVPRQKTRR